ncbi:MAG TPA: rod shape-determining protein [Oligoflexus sp.]|uniref:rod shape-determining protein n=1 Tax=Oligoflexus sp. TaxID=1971216 RepID=UPI002D48D982|nr:rod shape-determining protein [Oligoflexus sp.]HYX33243.1 rod shape-determining protein [Oligoflexus sp.]
MVCRLAMDLGTAKTIIADETHGIISKQPSLVGFDQRTRRPLAVGTEAARLQGRTPHSIVITRPLRAGRVHDFDAAALMLEAFLERLSIKPKNVQMVVGTPLGLTFAEKLALRNLIRNIGVRSVHLVEEHIASAAHESMNLMQECAGVMIDVGAGLTELALLGSGTILASRSLTWSGDRLVEEIEHVLIQNNALRPCRNIVESVQWRLLHPDQDPGAWSYRGFHLQLKKAMDFVLDRNDFRGLLPAFCDDVHQGLQEILEEAEIGAHDARLADGGLTLTGSAIPLELLRQSLETRTGLPVHISSEPNESVVHGLRSMLRYADYF